MIARIGWEDLDKDVGFFGFSPNDSVSLCRCSLSVVYKVAVHTLPQLNVKEQKKVKIDFDSVLWKVKEF